LPSRSCTGVRQPPENQKKIRNFKNEAHFGGLWGKCFRGNGPGRESILGESNVYRSVQTRPLHIVQFRRQGAGRKGLSKHSALPHAKIWGHTPDLNISFCGHAEALQILKNWRKNLRAISRYEFSKIWRKFDFFGVRGISKMQKSHGRCFLVHSRCVPNLVRIG